MALLAVTLNLFPNELYVQRGGRGRVKDIQGFVDSQCPEKGWS